MPDGWSDAETERFLADAVRKGMQDVGDAYEAVARDQFPVLDLFTTRAPGEHWSMPPGNLRRSARAEIAETLGGDAVVLGLADPVIRFRNKKRHKIRVTEEQVMRGVADRLHAKGYE